MTKASRDFQVFVKPASYQCNLGCHYCYYLGKEDMLGRQGPPRMPDSILERYIAQHMEAAPGPVVNFSWHGGEPTILGLEFFERIVELQRKHRPKDVRITNGIQTNGTLLDDKWCRFLARHKFSVGLSLDGPARFHDRYRQTKRGGPSHEMTARGFELLKKHKIHVDILCVVNENNVGEPLEIYRYFRKARARYISFLPLVERLPGSAHGVSRRTVPPEAFGGFLCAIFDEWLSHDIGRIKVQIFEEAARTAFGQEHSLCLFRPVCGDIPVIEHNGDFYSCDHYVQPEHRLGNITETSLGRLLDDPRQRAFGRRKAAGLPPDCQECDVLAMCQGECPKNRFMLTPKGQPGMNYLCAGYKMFFRHCAPFVQAVAHQWREQHRQAPTGSGAVPPPIPKVGRNQPCPCGSGKKYKNCCMNK